jgi:hypothetical protein
VLTAGALCGDDFLHAATNAHPAKMRAGQKDGDQKATCKAANHDRFLTSTDSSQV